MLASNRPYSTSGLRQVKVIPLFITDTFTRWVELYHTTDATALSAAECLLKHFGRFGAPPDNGPHFLAEIIREFLLLLGVKHCLSLAYSKKRML